MNSFAEGFIERQTINQGLLQTIRLIGEYKGKQELFKEQAPQVLKTLRGAAIIQSTESSNRIEGITVPLERIKKLVSEKTTPRAYGSLIFIEVAKIEDCSRIISAFQTILMRSYLIILIKKLNTKKNLSNRRLFH